MARVAMRRVPVGCGLVVALTLGLGSTAYARSGQLSAAPGHVVAARVASQDRRILVRHALMGDVVEPAAPQSNGTSGSAPPRGGPSASAAYGGPQRPFPLWKAGYLKRAHYRNAVGRFYTQLPGGDTASCTATTVARNLVLTAAHCVFDLQSRRRDLGFLFIPRMRGSRHPHGLWFGTVAYYWSNFASNPQSSIDYALVRLSPNRHRRHIGQVTGAFPVLEYASPRRIFSEGYPASGPFAHLCKPQSCYVWACYAPLGAIVSDSFGRQLGMGCRTGEGSSGGPWFAKYHHHWVIGSVTSTGVAFRGSSTFRNLWGPQFTHAIGRLLRHARSG